MTDPIHFRPDFRDVYTKCGIEGRKTSWLSLTTCEECRRLAHARPREAVARDMQTLALFRVGISPAETTR